MKRPLQPVCPILVWKVLKKGAVMRKSFMGIDIHKRFCVYTEIDPDGNVLRRGRFGNNIEEVADFAGGLSPKVQVVIEPTLNYLWINDQLEPYADSLHLAVPFKVRVIAESKSKTDRYDSRILAELLRTNFLPESYLAPKEIRVLRDLTRQRNHFIKNRTRFKNRIRHLLFLNGCVVKAADVVSPKAKNEIDRLCLPDTTRRFIKQCLAIIKELNREIGLLEVEIEDKGRDIEDVALLQTIPGVGYLTAVIIYAEVVDINRFKSRKAFTSYTGLVPITRASAEKVYTGGITRIGSRPLRTALVETALRVTRHSTSLNRFFSRIHYRSNVQKARVAVARKLSLIIYAMLKNREPFRC
jgi:transposase